MAIPPPKRIQRLPKRKGKGRVGRRLPLPPRTLAAIEEPVERAEGLREMPALLGGRSPKQKGGAAPRAIQGLHGQMSAWISEAFTKMGSPELIGKVPWHWNSRLTATMGLAHYRIFNGVTKPTKMEFAPRLFKRATPEQQRQTVFHECAHIVDYHNGTYTKGAAHGPSWKRIMRRSGTVPKRCHSVAPVGRVEVWCRCKTHHVTKKMHGKISEGKIYRCKKCASKISIVNPGVV